MKDADERNHPPIAQYQLTFLKPVLPDQAQSNGALGYFMFVLKVSLFLCFIRANVQTSLLTTQVLQTWNLNTLIAHVFIPASYSPGSASPIDGLYVELLGF